MHHTLITKEKLSGAASLPTMKRLPLSSSLQKHKSEKHTDSASSSFQLEREGSISLLADVDVNIKRCCL